MEFMDPGHPEIQTNNSNTTGIHSIRSTTDVEAVVNAVVNWTTTLYFSCPTVITTGYAYRHTHNKLVLTW